MEDRTKEGIATAMTAGVKALIEKYNLPQREALQVFAIAMAKTTGELTGKVDEVNALIKEAALTKDAAE